MNRLSKELTGKLVEWDLERGFGYVESGDQRYFLRWREVAHARRSPAVGDCYCFRVGKDAEGRAIARQARRLKGVGWMLRLAIWLGVVGGCLLLPTAAWYHYLAAVPMLGAALIAVNLLTYSVYLLDKRRAEAGGGRLPEIWLHLLELAGGWPAAALAQRRLHHKSSKRSYQVVFVLIVAAHQAVAIDLMQHWVWAHQVFAAFGRH